MSKRLNEVNNALLQSLSQNKEQRDVKDSIKTGQRVVLNYHLSADLKKQISGIVVKKTNKNRHYAYLHVLCGDIKEERFIKILALHSKEVEILNVFPIKGYKRADLTYLRDVNSIKSSI